MGLGLAAKIIPDISCDHVGVSIVYSRFTWVGSGCCQTGLSTHSDGL